MSVLSLLFISALTSATSLNYLSYFTAEDTNNNGILTTAQFVEGLISVFTKSHFEKDPQNINDFGREFVGRKLCKGFIKISDVQVWFDTKEIYEAFIDWKYIIEEGENHLSPSHIHNRPSQSKI